jgi:hypothetical protein
MTSFQRGASLSGPGLLFALAVLVLAGPAQAQDRAQDRYSAAAPSGYYDARQDGATSPYCCTGQERVAAEDPADWVDPCRLEPQCPRSALTPVQPESLTLPASFFQGGGGVGFDDVGLDGGGVVILVGGGGSAYASARAGGSVSIRIGGGRGGHGGGGHGHPGKPGGGGCGCGH